MLPRFRLVQKLTDKINRVARENLTGINVVHAFNAERYQNDKFDEPSTKMMETQLKNQRLMAVIQPAMGLCMNALALVIYWLGAALINQIPLADTVSRLNMFSEVVVFSTYATYVVMSFMMMVMIFMMLPSAQVSAERINEVLDCGEGIAEGGVSESGETGTVEFRRRILPLPRFQRERAEPHQLQARPRQDPRHNRRDRQRQIYTDKPHPALLRCD